MKKLTADYPPYEGAEPYIYLCFEEADARFAQPLLKRFRSRGCRVWYPLPDSDENRNQVRLETAGLVIVVNTESFTTGKAKRNMMYLQSKGVPIIVVDCADTDSAAAGEHSGVTHVRALGGIDDAAELQIITSEGFTQDFIGTPGSQSAPGWIKAVLGALIALVVLGAVYLCLSLTGVIGREQDPSEVVTLLLETVPEDATELERYPNLETVIIPQSEAYKADALLERYTVLLQKGE